MTDNTIECPICFESIGEKNKCVTECGHAFCLKCLIHASQTNASCPCCRATLIESSSNEDEDDDEEEYNDDEDDVESIDILEDEEAGNEYLDENENQNVEEITRIFKQKGYSLTDAIALLTGCYRRKDDEKNTKDYFKKLYSDFYEITEAVQQEVDKENDEIMLMEEEDNRIC